MSDRQLADFRGVVRVIVVLSNLRSYCGYMLLNWLGLVDELRNFSGSELFSPLAKQLTRDCLQAFLAA